MADILGGLQYESYDREYSDGRLIRRMARYLRPDARLAVLVTVAVILGAALSTALPVLIARGIDVLVRSVTVSGVAILVAAIVLAGVIGWAVDVLVRWCSARVVGNVVWRLRRDAFDALMAQDMAFFDEHPAGGMVNRVSTDTESLA